MISFSSRPWEWEGLSKPDTVKPEESSAGLLLRGASAKPRTGIWLNLLGTAFLESTPDRTESQSFAKHNQKANYEMVCMGGSHLFMLNQTTPMTYVYINGKKSSKSTGHRHLITVKC